MALKIKATFFNDQKILIMNVKSIIVLISFTIIIINTYLGSKYNYIVIPLLLIMSFIMIYLDKDGFRFFKKE